MSLPVAIAAARRELAVAWRSSACRWPIWCPWSAIAAGEATHRLGVGRIPEASPGKSTPVGRPSPAAWPNGRPRPTYLRGVMEEIDVAALAGRRQAPRRRGRRLAGRRSRTHLPSACIDSLGSGTSSAGSRRHPDSSRATAGEHFERRAGRQGHLRDAIEQGMVRGVKQRLNVARRRPLM